MCVIVTYITTNLVMTTRLDIRPQPIMLKILPFEQCSKIAHYNYAQYYVNINCATVQVQNLLVSISCVKAPSAELLNKSSNQSSALLSSDLWHMEW